MLSTKKNDIEPTTESTIKKDTSIAKIRRNLLLIRKAWNENSPTTPFCSSDSLSKISSIFDSMNESDVNTSSSEITSSIKQQSQTTTNIIFNEETMESFALDFIMDHHDKRHSKSLTFTDKKK